MSGLLARLSCRILGHDPYDWRWRPVTGDREETTCRICGVSIFRVRAAGEGDT